MKKTLSFILTLIMCIGLLPMAVTAADIPFTDVPETQWYYADVKSAYETGLINGKTTTLFKPDDNMTYAEAAKLAACMYQRFTDGIVSLKNGTPDWYSTYVDYAKNRGIITKDHVWNQQATRAGYMEIFAKALPDYALKAVNDVPDNSIPDVPMEHPQAEAIYKLYRAGILQGVDAAHNCNPMSTIKRSEVAAIVTRMMDTTKRVSFSMGTTAPGKTEEPEETKESTQKLKITNHPDDVTFNPDDDEVSFLVKVTGGEKPYTYQWYYKYNVLGWKEVGSTAEGYDEAMLVLTTDSIYLTDGVQFRCKITDDNGNSVTSSSAKATAKDATLKITKQPEDILDGKPDTPYYFTVTVSGGKAPYTYQWEWGEDGNWSKPSSGVASAKTAKFSLSFASAVKDQTVDVRCIIKDADGNTVTSKAATLLVPASNIDIDIPTSVDAKANETVTVTAESVTGGKAPYTYKWTYDVGGDYDFDPIAGATNSKTVSAKFSEADLKSGVRIMLEITDADGSKKTAFCKLNYVAAKPLSAVPTKTEYVIDDGDTGVISLNVTGGKAPYTYQWMYRNTNYNLHKNWTAVNKSNGLNLVFTDAIDAADLSIKGSAANFTNGLELQCKVTDANGTTVQTGYIKVKVEKLELAIETVKESLSAKDGETIVASVKVSGGTAPYTYTWKYKNKSGTWFDVTNGGGNQYTFTNGVGTADLSIACAYDDYTNGMQLICQVRDSAGTTVQSKMMTITVKQGIHFTKQPQSTVVELPGTSSTANVTFAAIVEDANGTVTYTWQYYNGISEKWRDITASDNTWATVSGANLTVKATRSLLVNKPKFRVVARDASGKSITSNAAALTLMELAATPAKASFSVNSGDVIDVKVNVSGGTQPYYYEWYAEPYGPGDSTLHSSVDFHMDHLKKYYGVQSITNGTNYSTIKIKITDLVYKDCLGKYTLWLVVFDSNGNEVRSDKIVIHKK